MKKKIGLLYSLSGTISIVGEGQLQASLLAIKETNKHSEFKFEPVIRDAKSDPKTAAREAYKLFKESNIDFLVGCYMSSVRNSLLPVLNETGGLLLYPTLYEGEQTHPNIFYLGAVPNQQVEPMLSWAINNLTNNFVLVGSDYVYPRSTNRQVKQWVENAGGSICIEEYFPLGCSNFGEFFTKLRDVCMSSQSFVVFSTIVGTSVVDFYKEYRKNNFPFPIISPITSEREIELMGKDISHGHICTSAYFQSLDTEINTNFVNAFKQYFGDQPISRDMAASYEAIRMLAIAYERTSKFSSGEDERQEVRKALKSLSFVGVQGKVLMDPETQHLWQWSRIGRVEADGKLNAFWTSSGPVPPKHDTKHSGLVINDKPECYSFQGFKSLIGQNNVFLECINIAQIAAKTSSSILITGETGTGKELLARSIHQVSPRCRNPFIAINCATIPQELISSEFFGYEEGSFTGAKKGGKPGKFELASGGTLFLDEIGEMSTQLQACLLRVIEENETYRLGGTKPVCFDVRLISSTNKNLDKSMNRKHTFRRDLYHRLSVFHIHLPALRDRMDDIALLSEYFLMRLNIKNAIEKKMHPDTLVILKRYFWPGNVRELANVIECAFYFSNRLKIIGPVNLPEYVKSFQTRVNTKDKYLLTPFDYKKKSSNGVQECTTNSIKNAYFQNINGKQFHSQCIPSIKENEKSLITKALTKSGYNVSRTATMLGISRGTLYRKIRKYNIGTKSEFLNG